jgi:hypothetical protein
VREVLASSHDLELAAHSANNAFRLYCKTRPPPVPESVKRGKALPRVGGAGWVE